MQAIIPPVEKELLKKELTAERFLRPTNKAHNEIYIVTAHNAPNVMREIGRLRELSFRAWGSGTGKDCDIDEYDFMKKPYFQLIVWNPDAEDIIGGYRFLPGSHAEYNGDGQPKFTMGHFFRFSDKFIKEYLPHTIELGRAFVQPDYQSAKMGMKSLFALDNLWDGLGALIHRIKDARYFVGKVTIFNAYPQIARELIYEYMIRFCSDPDRLIYPKNEVSVSEENHSLAKKLFADKAADDCYKILQKNIRNEGETIPPLINAYIGLTNTMRMFGTIYDPDFGYTYETGIMITMADLFESKRKRYIEPYVEYLKLILAERREARRLAREEKRKQKGEDKKETKKKFVLPGRKRK
jgi:hypothetical protein